MLIKLAVVIMSLLIGFFYIDKTKFEDALTTIMPIVVSIFYLIVIFMLHTNNNKPINYIYLKIIIIINIKINDIIYLIIIFIYILFYIY